MDWVTLVFVAGCTAFVIALFCGCTKTNKPKAKHETITRLDTRGLVNYPKV